MVSAAPVFALDDEGAVPEAEPQTETVEPVKTEPAVQTETDEQADKTVRQQEDVPEEIKVTIYNEDNECILDKEPVELEEGMTLDHIIRELDKDRNLNLDWEKCRYYINDEEILQEETDRLVPEDGDSVIIRAEKQDAEETGEEPGQEISDEGLMAELEVAPEELEKAQKKTAEKNRSQAAKENWGFDNEWAVMGLVRADCMTKEDAEKYCNRIAAYLESKKSSMLDGNMSSVNSRLAITLTSLGYDATDVNGKNLLEPLADMDYVTKQGINGPVFALLAFDSHNYDIPKTKNGAKQVTREALVDLLVSAQINDKGWAYSGVNPDVDMTAMVIQALTPYYNTNDKAKTAIDNALAWLSEIQKKDGSFVTEGSKVSSESQSQVIVALTGLGIDPENDEKFIKEGRGVMDALMDFYVAGGGFKHVSSNSGLNNLASQQAFYALTAYYRFKDGRSSLYDMSDIASLQKFSFKGEKGDSGTESKEEQTGGKPSGSTRSLGFLSLGLADKAASDLISETDETAEGAERADALSAEKEYNALQERKRLNSTLPWIYMAAGALAALALVVLLRERSRIE